MGVIERRLTTSISESRRQIGLVLSRITEAKMPAMMDMTIR